MPAGISPPWCARGETGGAPERSLSQQCAPAGSCLSTATLVQVSIQHSLLSFPKQSKNAAWFINTVTINISDDILKSLMH
jgi:hypothetical protein